MDKEYTRPLQEPIDTNVNLFSILEECVRRAPQDSLV